LAGTKVSTHEVFQSVMEIAQRRGFFWPAARDLYSEAPAGFWIYGPLGVKIKNKIVQAWRNWILKPEKAYEIETPSLLPLTIFKASGHLEHFFDKLVECNQCHTRWRADELLEDRLNMRGLEAASEQELKKLLIEHEIRCPKCGAFNWSDVGRFNLMFLTAAGAEAGEPNMGLRPETTQGSAVEFRRCYMVMRGKLPFIIAQLGHVFRNEISPRRGLIRMREFQQLEVHVFFDPEDISPYDKKLEPHLDYKLRFLKLDDAETGKIGEIPAREALKSGYTINELITYWLVLYQRFFNEVLGFPLKKLRYRELGPDERAHYASAHWDLEVYSEEMGWVELVNNAYRTDYDLKGHSRESGVDLTVQTDGKKVLPHLYEPSIGLDRTIFFELLLSFRKGDRVWMQLPRNIAPFDAAVFPLLSKEDLIKKAKEVEKLLSKDFEVFYDDKGSIGRRYRRMDEVGTPACITIDYQTLEDETVTLRDRDTMQQIRVEIEDLPKNLREFLSGARLEELGEIIGQK